jgi:hypothetical protein
VSQRARKRIEEAFGWMKTIGGLRKTRHRGRDKGSLDFHADRCRLQPHQTAEAPRSRIVIDRPAFGISVKRSTT